MYSLLNSHPAGVRGMSKKTIKMRNCSVYSLDNTTKRRHT